MPSGEDFSYKFQIVPTAEHMVANMLMYVPKFDTI
jgi:hypothetical protein